MLFKKIYTLGYVHNKVITINQWRGYVIRLKI